jgi:SAM-dependent methyltransferase
LKKLLNIPFFYNGLQRLIGAMRAREIVVREYLQPEINHSILDIGCGTGYVINYLPECRYIGFDINSTYIEYARRHYGGRGEFHQKYLTREILESFGLFDRVMMNGLLHHLDDTSATNLLQLAKSALKPQGIVVGIDGCHREGLSAVERWVLKNDRGQYVRHQLGYEMILRSVFTNVFVEMRPDLFLIYRCLVWRCTNS